MRPEDVGLTESNLVMGKHSGRHAFRTKLEELGYTLADNQVQDAFVRFKALADAKKEVFDDDIIALVEDQQTSAGNSRVTLSYLRVISGTDGPQQAAIRLMIDGQEHACEATGDGPVDAAFNCVKQLVPHNARLMLYQVHAVTGGTDAQAEVTVRLEEDGKLATGNAADTDTMVASVRAYVYALNRLFVRRGKSAAPDDDALKSA